MAFVEGIGFGKFFAGKRSDFRIVFVLNALKNLFLPSPVFGEVDAHSDAFRAYSSPKTSGRGGKRMDKACFMKKLEEIEKRIQQHLLAEEERLVSQNDEDLLEYLRKIKEKSAELLERFAHHKVFEDRALRAVVGFGEDGVPRYWNLKEGNLLVCGPASGGLVAQGNLLALLSLCRFSEEELNWFYVARESARGFFAEDSHCRGSGALWRGNCGEALASLRAEIDKRAEMSKKLLEKQPYIIVAFAGIDESLSRYWQQYRKLFSVIFTQGAKLKIACVLSTGAPMQNSCFYWFRNSFTAYLLGRACDLGRLYCPHEQGHVFLAKNNSATSGRALYCSGEDETVVETYRLVLQWL